MRSAGDLKYSVTFSQRIAVDNGDGVFVGAWDDRFSARAGFIHLRGGEAVMSGRLAGRHPQVVFVRSSELSRAVRVDWRIVDMRSGAVFNIRDVTPSDDGLWIDFLCEEGVNPG